LKRHVTAFSVEANDAEEPEPAPEEPQPELSAEDRKRVLRSLQRSSGRTATGKPCECTDTPKPPPGLMRAFKDYGAGKAAQYALEATARKANNAVLMIPVLGRFLESVGLVAEEPRSNDEVAREMLGKQHAAEAYNAEAEMRRVFLPFTYAETTYSAARKALQLQFQDYLQAKHSFEQAYWDIEKHYNEKCLPFKKAFDNVPLDCEIAYQRVQNQFFARQGFPDVVVGVTVPDVKHTSWLGSFF